jgi:dCTP diphosphatase
VLKSCGLCVVTQVGEVGELSEIFQWKGEVPRGLSDWNDAEKEHLGEELSDVLLYLVRLADVCNVDLGESALRKLQKNAVKYPVELCKGNSKKYRELAKKGTVRRNLNNTENLVYHDRL